jgi:predicted PurR-regulated permease PerM
VLAWVCQLLPYFGPLVASVLPTGVSLSLGTWWQPLATAGVFLALHGVDAYATSPILYGKAVRFDPVTILFGALFFGAVWGPVGPAVATPMLIVLRGLFLIAPDTPALDTLADVKDEKADGAPRDGLAAGAARSMG